MTKFCSLSSSDVVCQMFDKYICFEESELSKRLPVG